MATYIVYTDPNTLKLAFLTIPAEMFDANSQTRQALANANVTFNSDSEVITWVANKDVPLNTPYYLVSSANFPATGNNRDNWYYDEATSSVKDQ